MDVFLEGDILYFYKILRDFICVFQYLGYLHNSSYRNTFSTLNIVFINKNIFIGITRLYRWQLLLLFMFRYL